MIRSVQHAFFMVVCLTLTTLCQPASTDSAATAPARPVLAGDLPAVVPANALPYLVSADIIVKPGATVTIEPGVRLLFRNFTGLHVHGTLLAKGTDDNPIMFTSEHDRKAGSTSGQDPAPYDWNGITVTENAVGTVFENCRIGYSLFGINSLTDYLTIRSTLFRQNGRSDITIKGSRHEVPSGTAFSYQPLGASPAVPSAAVAAVTPPKKTVRNIVMRTASAAVVLAGCGVGVWKYLDYRKSDTAFWELNDASKPANLRNPEVVNDWETARKNRQSDLAGFASGAGAALLGCVGFTITLF